MIQLYPLLHYLKQIKLKLLTVTESKSTYRQWKRNKLFAKFPTDSNKISSVQPEFNVNLNNRASTLSKILSQSCSTINSNLREPERLLTTTSQTNWLMSSNSLVSFQPPPYPDPLPDQFIVVLLDFVSPKTQYCFGCRRHSRRYTTDKNIGLHGA